EPREYFLDTDLGGFNGCTRNLAASPLFHQKDNCLMRLRRMVLTAKAQEDAKGTWMFMISFCSVRCDCLLYSLTRTPSPRPLRHPPRTYAVKYYLRDKVGWLS